MNQIIFETLRNWVKIVTHIRLVIPVAQQNMKVIYFHFSESNFNVKLQFNVQLS